MPALPTKDLIDTPPRPHGGRGRGILRVIGLSVGAAGFAAAGFGGGWYYFSQAQSPLNEALSLIQRDEAPSAEGGGDAPQKVARETPETETFVTSYFDFAEPLTTNLAGSRRFLQIGVTLSTQYDETVMKHVEAHISAIRSDMLAVASGFTEESIAGVAGRELLAIALRDAINQRLEKLEGFGGIENVHFTSFVLQ